MIGSSASIPLITPRKGFALNQSVGIENNGLERKARLRKLISKNNPRLFTRQKKDATARFPEIAEPLQNLRSSFILDGEICLLDDRGVPNFEAMRGRGCASKPASL